MTPKPGNDSVAESPACKRRKMDSSMRSGQFQSLATSEELKKWMKDADVFLVRVPASIDCHKLKGSNIHRELMTDNTSFRPEILRGEKELILAMQDDQGEATSHPFAIKKTYQFREKLESCPVPEIEVPPRYIVPQLDSFKSRHPIYGINMPHKELQEYVGMKLKSEEDHDTEMSHKKKKNKKADKTLDLDDNHNVAEEMETASLSAKKKKKDKKKRLETEDGSDEKLNQSEALGDSIVADVDIKLEVMDEDEPSMSSSKKKKKKKEKTIDWEVADIKPKIEPMDEELADTTPVKKKKKKKDKNRDCEADETLVEVKTEIEDDTEVSAPPEKKKKKKKDLDKEESLPLVKTEEVESEELNSSKKKKKKKDK